MRSILRLLNPLQWEWKNRRPGIISLLAFLVGILILIQVFEASDLALIVYGVAGSIIVAYIGTR